MNTKKKRSYYWDLYASPIFFFTLGVTIAFMGVMKNSSIGVMIVALLMSLLPITIFGEITDRRDKKRDEKYYSRH